MIMRQEFCYKICGFGTGGDLSCSGGKHREARQPEALPATGGFGEGENYQQAALADAPLCLRFHTEASNKLPRSHVNRLVVSGACSSLHVAGRQGGASGTGQRPRTTF
jgi:hypothetical protein